MRVLIDGEAPVCEITIYEPENNIIVIFEN